MSRDLSLIVSMKEVLESVAEGKGLARSIVEKLGGAGPAGAEAARLALLGRPIPVALRPLVEGGSPEVSMVAALMVSAPRSSTRRVGRSGKPFVSTLEGWLRSRESRELEQKVLGFRGLVASGVLGAVTSMLASLGPLVGNLDFGGGARAVNPGPLLYTAAAMAGVGSGMLGMYMSGKRMFLNVALTLAVFAVVAAAASPLGGITPSGVWGIK